MTENIFAKGCLIKLSVSKWTGRIKIPSKTLLDGSNHADVDPGSVGAHKRLVDGKALKDVVSIESEARSYLYSRSLPFPLDGAVFVPTAQIPEIDARLAAFRDQYEAAANAFCADFDAIREKARIALGSLYSIEDYPTNLRERFSFAWQPLVLSAPGETQLLDPALVARANADFERLMREAGEQAVNALRTRFAKSVDHMVERLAGEGSNGKPKVFQESLVGNLKGFFESFRQLNISDDRALADLVQRAQDAIDGVEASDLRKDGDLRARVASQMEELQDSLDGLMVDRPTRKLRFGKVAEAAE